MVARSGEISSLLEMLPPFALRAAATLRLSDLLPEHPTVPELAGAASADPDALGRLLRYLVQLGVYREPEPGRFEVAPVGRLLAGRGQVGLREWLDLDGAGGRMELALAGLVHAVRTGGPGFDAVFGRSFWDDLSADQALAASFDALMAAKSRPVAADLARYDWGGVRSITDVGGGEGLVLTTILAANPGMRGVLFEQPATAARGQRLREGPGLADRLEVVGGTFLEHVPGGSDAYLLFDVLHNWDDETAAGILRRCAAAAGPAGQVFVVEEVPGSPPDRNGLAMDLKMLALFGGRQRTLTELGAMAAGAGLRHGEVERLPSGFTLACFPAGLPAGGAGAG